MERYYVYVLKSLKDNFHYIGHTQDLKNRLKIHNYKKVRSTKGHVPFEMVYTETFTTRPEACKREMHLKQAEGNIWLRNYLNEKGLW
ncbi:MAG: GIY-YIG nuclease family protein [Candidatus Marinimicrobia bacterium]|nr:GIY-YIG nuclease family protein [Candidatus Neomarinimicrobiota bacterium]